MAWFIVEVWSEVLVASCISSLHVKMFHSVGSSFWIGCVGILFVFKSNTGCLRYSNIPYIFLLEANTAKTSWLNTAVSLQAVFCPAHQSCLRIHDSSVVMHQHLHFLKTMSSCSIQVMNHDMWHQSNSLGMFVGMMNEFFHPFRGYGSRAAQVQQQLKGKLRRIAAWTPGCESLLDEIASFNKQPTKPLLVGLHMFFSTPLI